MSIKSFLKKSHVIILISFLVIGCSKENNSPDQGNAKAINQSELDAIGSLHNEAMKYINERYSLEYKKQKTTLTEDQKLQLVIDFTQDFLANKVLTIHGQTVSQYPTATVQELKDFRTNLAIENLGPFEQFRTTEATLNDITYIESQYQNAYNIENYQVMTACAIFKHSLQYWNENSTNLLENYNKNSGNKADDINWYSIAFADGSGAYSGAAYGAVLGPAGAVSGGIAFGIMNSAVAGFVGSLWD